MKRAFTLIELLVVIAIIAILAAILFPVFAQAKQAAKKTLELSNAKNIGTAFQIYASDYDDMTTTVSKAPVKGLDGLTTYVNKKGNTVDTAGSWYLSLQPYCKSWDMFLSPVRADSFGFNVTTGVTGSDPFSCSDNENPTSRCLGFGYNDGWVSDTGYGLLNTQTTDANGYTLRTGRSLTSLESPANTTAFGSSNDNPGYSVAMDNILSRYPDNISSKNIRYAGQFEFGFADGHAKMVQMRSAEYPSYGLIAIPANKADAMKWCWSPTFVPDATFDGGTANPAAAGDYPLQSNTLTCSAAIDDIYANAVVNP